MAIDVDSSPATSAPPDTPPAAPADTAPASAPPESAGHRDADAAQPTTPPAAKPDTAPADWEKRYKDVQAHATRMSQTLAALGDLQELQRTKAFVEQLSQDPEFLTWAQRRAAKATTGTDDPDTLRALQIIDERAKAIADQKLEAALAPLRAEAIKTRINTTFAQMDRAHGPEWREQRQKMAAILAEGIQAGHFAPDVEQNFDLRTLNLLYAAATADDPAFAAKQHEKRLKARQAQATTATPGTAPTAVGGGNARTIEEAFAQARRQLGL